MSVTFARMAGRDGTPADPADPVNTRYTGAQRLYAAGRPADRADLVIDNTDLANPYVLGPVGTWPAAGSPSGEAFDVVEDAG